MIPLATLCAVLVAVIAWQRVTIRHALERGDGLSEIADYRKAELAGNRANSAAIIAEAYALLHDKRHKGREESQKAWQAARDEWSAKVKGAKA